ncbi:hypothetical protein POM88_051641 [Heracleum sosnowskyi]|uniref:Uncharacterized protein n=1 Tax=Heracleum sosnowskyi TaxID=360622 RepID=A0AAD8GZZ2_9APIA|nr:hypothetical protein POM88_051641 [Heracleum sosnowskyi]
MASPHSLQARTSLAIMILANLFSILQPLLNQLMMPPRYGSVLFFQVAVSDKKRAFRRKLTRITKNADTSTLYGLKYVLKEVVNALLQCNDSSFHFTNLQTRYNSMENLSKCFQEFLYRGLKAHGKHENPSVNVDGNVKHKDSMVTANSSTGNEYTVVTVMVLATRKHLISSFKENGQRYFDSIEVLQTLKRIPENEIQSVEVLWSPPKKDEVLLEDDLVRNFHRLI